MQPFDYHPAQPVEIENRARELLRLADEAADHQAVTDRAFDPATASWDGVAAAELRAAPEPVRRQAELVASRLSWASVPLRYWADQVRLFNATVDTLLTRLAGVPGEVERQLVAIVGELRAQLDDPDTAVQRDHLRHRLVNELRREWEEAYDTYIHEGARTVAGMLSRGPTLEHLRLARESALMPTGGLVAYLAVGWDRTAALGEVRRIAGALLDPAGPPPTVEELDRLAGLLSRYEGDAEFAYRLLTGLGPQGLLELTAQVATLTIVGADADAGVSAKTVGAIQAGLAAALATATRDADGDAPHQSEFTLPPEWITGLVAAGGQTLPVGVTSTPKPEIYGYQALGVLLGAGGYDSRFLTVVGHALLEFERDQGGSAVWSGVRPMNFRLDWIDIDSDAPADLPAGYDPVIGLLKALSDNPEAAKQFFIGPGEQGPDDGGSPWLDYLLTDREWPIDAVTGPMHLRDEHPNPGIELFGQLLERITMVDVDERSHRIVEAIIHAVATDESAMGFPNDPSGSGARPAGKTGLFGAVDIVHQDFRPHLGRIASHYIEDIHWLSEGNVGPADKLTAGRMRLAGVDERHLVYFLAEIGKDPRARSEVVAAELAYADRLYRRYLDGWDGTDSDAVEHANRKVTRPLSIVLGAVDFGASEAMRHGYAEADEAHNEAVSVRLFWLHLGGNAASDAVPGGKTLTFLSATVLDHLEEQWRHDSTGLANYYVGDLRHSGAMAVEDMLDVIIYEQITSQLTPEEFLTRVSDDDYPIVMQLVYPKGHPDAGSFVSPKEWQERHWDAWDTYKGSMDATFVDAPQEDAVQMYHANFDRVRGIMGY